MKILKFGGTSLGSTERICEVIKIIKAINEDRLIVVVSAMAGVTDRLLQLTKLAESGEGKFEAELGRLFSTHQSVIQEIIPTDKTARERIDTLATELTKALKGIAFLGEASARSKDLVVSFGELFSATIISSACRVMGLNTSFLDSTELIVTDEHYGNAKVDFEATYKRIKLAVRAGSKISVMPGYIARSITGDTTTLGRGGSDYTAALVGAAIEAEEIQIWTDVSGILSADPRVVPDAIVIPEISYEEAMELSHFGAKVIYPPTILPAYRAGIPIRIKNSFRPNDHGSLVRSHSKGRELPVTGISSVERVALLQVQGGGMQGVSGTAARVFQTLSKNEINVILISQASSEHSICFAVEPDKGAKAKSELDKEFEEEILRGLIEDVTVDESCSIVAIIGERMRSSPGVSSTLFDSLSRNGINVKAIAQGSSERNISVVITAQDRVKALRSIHEAFFLGTERKANVFLIGDGLIGSTLIKQIKEHQEALRSNHQVELILQAVTNSRETYQLKDWQKAGTHKADLHKFINRIISQNLPNSILVDCTSSTEPSQFYQSILSSGISIVTPNKKPLTGHYDEFSDLVFKRNHRTARFLFETCVGAGLPIIGTLQDLIKSGDEIISIEAVLSGTLSYIFNTYTPEIGFASVVRSAIEKGYAEPDARDDLSGMDVARKLLILARLSGQKMELNDIKLESLVPEIAKAGAKEGLIPALEENEGAYAELFKKAKSVGGKLCYQAKLSKEEATIGIRIVSAGDPFSALSGSDNMIVFRTARYNSRPLVIQGPGAGAGVTAAGIMADILRVII